MLLSTIYLQNEMMLKIGGHAKFTRQDIVIPMKIYLPYMTNVNF